MAEPAMRLDLFKNSKFDRGASRLTEAAWIIVQALLFASWLPGSGWRVRLLRAYLSRASYQSRFNNLLVSWDGLRKPTCNADLVLVAGREVSCS